MISAYIVDDEPLARSRIRNLLKEYHTVELLGESGEVNNAIQQINDKKPKLLFLDIQLKAKKGFSILEQIDYLPWVIFTTAYSHYAVKAFDYYAIDYLLKPFNDDRFHKALTRILDLAVKDESVWGGKLERFLSEMRSQPGTDKYLLRIPVRISDKTYFVSVKDIQYIKASAYYAELFTVDKKHIIRESLSNLAQELNPNDFLRIHRSSIINIHYLKEVIAIGFGDLEVRMNDGEPLRVSKSYKEELVKKLGMR